MTNSIILIGGGGHCKACIDVIEAEGRYTIEGILDAEDKVGTMVLDYPVIGTDEKIDQLIQKGCYFLITVGQIKNLNTRKEIYQTLIAYRAKLAKIISPTAYVSKHARIGEGTIVMHNVSINAGVLIGNNSILNTGCLIEHDSLVGDHVHLSTHAILNGQVVVDENCFIGSNAVVAQAVHIKTGVVVGAGSVVIKNIDEPGVYAGNPARLIK